MKDELTSLDRLHDLVLPPAVAWWPPAPGWYALGALLAVAAGWLAWRWRKRRQTDAYRRAALHELAGLRDAPAIAELLRRTALAVVPRTVIACMTGTVWTDWLEAQGTEAMSAEVRGLLSVGVYQRPNPEQPLGALRGYAARWIARHRVAALEDPRID